MPPAVICSIKEEERRQAALKKVSPNNPTIRRLKERKQERQALVNQCLNLSRRVFAFHHRDDGAIEKGIVSPILNDLITTVTSFGAIGDIRTDFSSLFNPDDVNDSCHYEARCLRLRKAFCTRERLPRKRRKAKRSVGSATSMSTISWQDDLEDGPKEEAPRSVLFTTQKMKRLSVTEPVQKNDRGILFRQMKEKILKLSKVEENVSEEVAAPLVDSIVSCAVFRSMVNRAKDLRKQKDMIRTIVEELVNRSVLASRPPPCECSTFIPSTMSTSWSSDESSNDDFEDDVYSASESSEMSEDLSFEEFRAREISKPATQEVCESTSSETSEEYYSADDYEVPGDLVEKVGRYLHSLKELSSDVETQTDISLDFGSKNAKGDNSTQTESTSKDAFTETDEGEKALYINHVPTRLNSVGKVIRHLERFGAISEIKHLSSNTFSVVFANQESSKNAMEAMNLKPFGKRWLSNIVLTKMATERDFTGSPSEEGPSPFLFAFANAFFNAEEELRLREKRYLSTDELGVEMSQKFSEACEIASSNGSMESFKGLLKLTALLTNAMHSAVLKDCWETMDKEVDPHLTKMIVDLSFDQEVLSKSSLETLGVENGITFSECILDIPDNWIKVLNGEVVQEQASITIHRHAYLIKVGNFEAASKLVQGSDAPEIIHAHLGHLVALAEPDPTLALDEFFATIGLCLEKSEQFPLHLLERALLITPPDRREKANEVLLACLCHEVNVMELVSRFCHEGWNSKVIDQLKNRVETGVMQMTSTASRAIIEDIYNQLIQRRPQLTDKAFALVLEAFKADRTDWSMQAMLRYCNNSEKAAIVVQGLVQIASVINENILKKIISHFETNCQSYLDVLADAIASHFDPIAHFQLVALHGSGNAGMKILEKMRDPEHDSRRDDELVDKMIDHLLPRCPDMKKVLFDRLLEKFPNSPSIFKGRFNALVSSEEEMKNIIGIVEANTMFGQKWTNDLGIIMNDLCKLCTSRTWTDSKKAIVAIILDQFHEDPANWTFHLLQFGQSEDIKKACQSLQGYLTRPDAAVETLAGTMRGLLSKVLHKWPDARPELANLFQEYFAKKEVSPSQLKGLFSQQYSTFWINEMATLKRCLNSLWRRSKITTPGDDWLDLLRTLWSVYSNDSNVSGMITQLIIAFKENVSQRLGTMRQEPVTFKIQNVQLGRCIVNRVGDRCEGCSLLQYFLQSNEIEKYFQVRQEVRRCVSHLLGQNGLARKLNLQLRELSRDENRQRPGGRNCGALQIVKKGQTQSVNEEKARNYKRLVQECVRILQPSPAAVPIPRTLATSATPSTSGGATRVSISPVSSSSSVAPSGGATRVSILPISSESSVAVTPRPVMKREAGTTSNDARQPPSKIIVIDLSSPE